MLHKTFPQSHLLRLTKHPFPQLIEHFSVFPTPQRPSMLVQRTLRHEKLTREARLSPVDSNVLLMSMIQIAENKLISRWTNKRISSQVVDELVNVEFSGRNTLPLDKTNTVPILLWHIRNNAVINAVFDLNETEVSLVSNSFQVFCSEAPRLSEINLN